MQRQLHLNGVVTSITVSTAGTGYSDATPPVVLIGADPVLEEKIQSNHIQETMVSLRELEPLH